jgi:ribosomal protein S18 acetylase RimI-like enzyme
MPRPLETPPTAAATAALQRACAIEEQAWRDIFTALAETRARRGLAGRAPRIERAEGATALLAPGIDNLLFNRAFDVDAASLPLVVAAYARAGVDRYLLHARATPQPGARLDARDAAALGVERFRRSWVKLAAALEQRDARATPAAVPRLRLAARADVAAGLELAAARRRDAAACARLLADGFDLGAAAVDPLAALVGRQRWHVFAAYDGELPVAVGAMFVAQRTAYLAFAATRPSYRGRGLQQALLAARIGRARALGCQLICSETGAAVRGERNTSQNNLERFGMQVVGWRENYAPQGTRWAA